MFKHKVFAGVVAGALFAVAGAGGAVAGSLVTSAGIKDDTIRSRDVRDGSIGRADLRERVVDRLDRGLVRRVAYATPREWGAGENFASASCPEGFTAVNGGVQVLDPAVTKWAVDVRPWPGEDQGTWVSFGMNLGQDVTVVPWALCIRS